MKGQIANFSPQHGQGIIMAEDGRNYPFMSQQWQHANAPMVGQPVEFGIDAHGYAIGVVELAASNAINLTKPAESHIPSLTQSYPNANGWQVDNLGGLSAVNAAWAEEENYGFFDWVKKGLSNYANFKGRARRKEYWYFYLGSMIATLIGLLIDSMLGFETPVLYGLMGLALFLPSLSVGVRRLHDINKSGWWMLIALIPIIGGILVLVWYCTDTKPNVNQWGAPARRLP